MVEASPQYATADNTVLTGFTTLAPGTSIGGTGSYFGSNVVFSSGFRYVASDCGWFMRSDGASGVSFHAGPAGAAGAPFGDTVAWVVSPSGVFSLPAAPLAVSSGGTGAVTAAGARNALGLAAVASSGQYADLGGLPAIPAASGTVPLADGTGAAGTSAAFARADHVHPTDPSRAPVNNPAFGGNLFSFANNSTAATVGLEIGSATTANYLYYDLHSSGTGSDYDVRLAAYGGGAAPGQGTYHVTAGSFLWNGSTVLTTAQPVAVAQGGTGAATAAAARAALGACAAATPAIQGAPVITVGGDCVGERFVTGPYGVAHYYDGSNYYFLVTQSGQQATANYSGIRPFHVNLASGQVGMDNGLAVKGGLSADSLTLSGPFNVTAQGGSCSRALSSRFADQLSVLDFGAVGDGQADDTVAIQAALNAAANGASVLAPPLTFKVSSTLLIGNGSAGAASTRWGVTLKGHSPAPFPAEYFSGFPKTGTARLLWAGAPGGTMVKVAGPLNSWSLCNL